jgi:hypothetical protein
LSRRPAVTGAALAAAAGLALAGLALAGCGQVDTALRAQQATVTFRPDTTSAMVAAVRSACGRLPGLHLEPAPGAAGTGPTSVRYKISAVTAADLTRLQACLTRSPAVIGVSIKDTAGQG